MNCPKCHAAMETVDFQGVTVDRCTACKGIWFDAWERSKLNELKNSQSIDIGDAANGRQMDAVTHIDCPRCHKPMVSRNDIDHHDIAFEICTACMGLFLDAGEFTELKSYTFRDYLHGLFHKSKPKK
jgi:uncharacterized protein